MKKFLLTLLLCLLPVLAYGATSRNLPTAYITTYIKQIVVGDEDANFAVVSGDDVWGTGTGAGKHGETNPDATLTFNLCTIGCNGNDTATWTPTIPTTGDYKVYAWWVQAANRATDAPYTVNYNGGSDTTDVNQQANGSQWNLLGTYSFLAGTAGNVVLTDDSNERVIADAVKFEPDTCVNCYERINDFEIDTDVDLTALTTVTSASGTTVVLADTTPFASGNGWEAGDTFVLDPDDQAELLTVDSVVHGTNTITTVETVTGTYAGGEDVAAGIVVELWDNVSTMGYAGDGGKTITGATTTADYYRVMMPATGHGHAGVYGDGVLISDFGAITETYSQYHDLTFIVQWDSASDQFAVKLSSSYAKAVGCFATATNIGAAEAYGFLNNTASRIIYWINCGAINCDASGFAQTAATDTFVYNCTSAGNGEHGYYVTGGAAGADFRLTNCLAEGNVGDGFNESAAGQAMFVNYCASDDATLSTAGMEGQVGNRETQTFVFVDSGSDDYRLACDSGARDFGVSLSEDAYFSFTDSVEGDITRPVDLGWDIGFSESSPTGTYCQPTPLKTYMSLYWATVTAGAEDIHYVDNTATGNDDGTTWEHAFDTIQEGLTAADAYDVVEVSGGTAGQTYTENVTMAVVDVTLKGSSEASYNGTVTIDCSGDGADCIAITESVTIQDMTVTDPDASFYAIEAAGADKLVYLDDVIMHTGEYGILADTGSDVRGYRCTIRDFTLGGLNTGSTAATDTYWEYTLFKNNLKHARILESDHEFVNCTFIGSDEEAIVYAATVDAGDDTTFTNCIFTANVMAAGADHVVYNNGSGIVTIEYSVPLPTWGQLLAGGYGFSGCTPGEGNVYGSPGFRVPRYDGISSLSIDDSGNIDDFLTLMAVAQDLNQYGSCGVNTSFTVTSDDYDDLSDAIDNGHGVANHGKGHGKLDELDAIDIQYTGAAGSATITIDALGAETLTTQLNGAGTDLDIDLTNPLYSYTTGLVNYIDGQADYSASLVTVDVNHKVWYTSFADLAAVDIKTAEYTILLNETRFYDTEIGDGITEIEAAIAGFTVDSQVYAHGATTVNAIDELILEGVLGARGSQPLAATNREIWNLYIYKTAGLTAGDYIGSEDDTGTDFNIMNVEARVAAIAEAISYGNLFMSIYEHGFTSFSLANWTKLMNAYATTGILVLNLSDAYSWIRDRSDHASVDGYTYYTCATKTDSCLVDNLDMHPTSTSSIKDAGTLIYNVLGYPDYEGVSVVSRTPNIGLYETVLESRLDRHKRKFDRNLGGPFFKRIH